ncbi:MAG: tRNA 2-thiouridine(34) synthase MnmA [Candidatus Kapabacteria bacterium]|nr:tRNA 2-thiouridine(34) synthase MnmA [Candidatus Kapabacteria bacterium]
MKRNSKRVVVGMSGGVDSCTAAALLVEQGYEVIGITIKTYKYEDVGGNVGNDSSCCSLDGINDARKVALQLGIPHYVVDFTEPFREKVIDYFVDDYMDGNTPNPCVQCNRHIKWAEMLRKADSLGAEFIATGHYARIRKDETSGRYILSRGNDNKKDQSYALWGLSQESLSRTIFPLAEMTKEESRAVAERVGLPIARKKESYEICFIPDNDYNRFLRDNVENLDAQVDGGDIVLDGEVIGKHTGFPFYTIGQRRGLGVSHHEPLFVLNVIQETNTLVVGTEEKLLHSHLRANDVNIIKYDSLRDPREFTVKIRYKDDGAPALCHIGDDGLLKVDFLEPRKAITPGQSVVLYEGLDVVGGGVIHERF